MGIQDKVTGRLKQAAGDLAGDEKLRNEGLREERKAEAKRELREAEQRVARLRDEIAQLEYDSSGDVTSPEGDYDQTTRSAQGTDAQTGAPRSGVTASDTALGEQR